MRNDIINRQKQTIQEQKDKIIEQEQTLEVKTQDRAELIAG